MQIPILSNRHKLIVSAGLLIATFGISACDYIIDPPECTLMGCFDSLEVALGGDIPDDFVMTIEAPGINAITVHCVNGEDVETDWPEEKYCGPGGFTSYNFAPKQITITIRSDRGVFKASARPEYEDFRPNGPRCHPICRRGYVAITVAED